MAGLLLWLLDALAPPHEGVNLARMASLRWPLWRCWRKYHRRTYAYMISKALCLR